MKMILTSSIQEAYEVVIILQNNLPKIINQNFWQHKVSISEKIEYLNQIAITRKNLWQVVCKEYPEAKEKNISVNFVNVSWEEEK